MNRSLGLAVAAAFLTLTPALAHLEHGTPLAAVTHVPDVEAGAVRQDYQWSGSALVAESFWLAEALPARLASLEPGQRIVVAEFPVGPGERAAVEFEYFEVYAPNARIIVIDDEGEREIERSPRVHLLGTAVEDPRIRVGLSIDPGGRGLSGLAAHPAGTWDLYELDSDPAAARRTYEVGIGLAERLGVDIETRCDTPDHPEHFDPDLTRALAGSQPEELPGTHLAVVGFDTDGELIQQMFGGSTAAANSAIGDFITASNVIYERDMSLRLQQGETVLRTNPATDPYSAGTTPTLLTEVEEWWAVNKAGVFRTFVALLSGTSPSNFSGSGIAWVDVYCNDGSVPAGFDGGSFSATKVLKGIPLNSSSNVGLLDHEIGHNAGSGHTHCYTPPIDFCFRNETGCYSGPESCPNHTGAITGISAGAGTIMSYCGLGAVSCPSENFFHPRVIDRVKMSIDANHPTCITHVSAPPPPPPACTPGIPNEVTLNTMQTGTQVHKACQKIYLKNGFSSGSGSNVTLQAPEVNAESGVSLGSSVTVITSVP